MTIYARLGVLYYLIYNPDFWRRDRQEPFEVYRLIDGVYQRQIREPFWMPEIGLGIGRGIGYHLGFQREWLYWFDQRGNRFPTPEEQAAELRSMVERYRDRFGELPEAE